MVHEYDTLQGTNISPINGILKMIFLFPRWDMLIPWRVLVANISFWDIGYFALDVVVNFSELPKKICCWLPCSWSGVWKSCEDICIKDRIAKFANISLDEDSTRLKSIQLTSRSKFDRWWVSSEQNKQTNLDKTAKLLVFSPPIFDESKRLSFSIPLTLLCLAADWRSKIFMMLPSHFQQQYRCINKP